ncbi:MAG: band 7 protein [Planctomycetota bacterium]|nr:MAG: band 7 protein [Planctomycetota bacterium]
MGDSSMSNISRSQFNQPIRNPGTGLLAVVLLTGFAVALSWMVYSSFRIDVGSGEIAILTHKVGNDLTNGQEVAPDETYKGIQKKVLTEGRYFYNPYAWSWEVVPQTEIMSGDIGAKISLTGDDLGYGEFLAKVDANGDATTKGIMPDVLNPGRYPVNPYLYSVEVRKPVTIPAGFKGVLTNLAAPLASKPNRLLVDLGERGVQQVTLEPGTHYLSPYVYRVDLVDCRSQRFNLGEEGDMGFPSKDGFWVSLDGIIEFRVDPKKASEVYVLFNQAENGPAIDEEIVKTVIMPNARSFCRLQGSNSSGRDFIQGDTRKEFQDAFEISMRLACEPLGIEIIQALITRIRPPEQIALPVRTREIAKQQELQYKQQTLQQESEQKLAVGKAMVDQKQALVGADQLVVQVTTQAMQEQEVALTKANENLAVAQFKLDASIDEAAAITAHGKAAADVVRFDNEAEAAGWKKAVDAFDGDGKGYAQYVMFQKLSSSYRRIMVNTADSPIMKIFESINDLKSAPDSPSAEAPLKRAAAAIKPATGPELTKPASEATAAEATPLAATLQELATPTEPVLATPPPAETPATEIPQTDTPPNTTLPVAEPKTE